jgi:hypothetical protein
MAFLGYIKCLGYDIYVPVYSDTPENENITNAPIIKASSLHSVGYPDTIEGISQWGQGYVIYSNVGAEGAANSIANLFGKYHFETVNGVTPFAGLVLGDNRNLDGYNRLYVHCNYYEYASYLSLESPVYLGWNPEEFQLCMALVSGTNKLTLYGDITGSSNSSAGHIRIPELEIDLTVDNIANYLKLYQEREITDSWAQIQQAASLGIHTTLYHLGDTKTFTHGTYGEVVMQIVAFDEDDKADGTGKAAISWVSRDIITTHVMNSDLTNANGWEASEMRTWLQDKFYAALPEDVKVAIVNVNKPYYDYTTQTTKTCTDNVWIPSVREVFGAGHDNYGVEDSGAEYTDVFNSQSARVKNFNGSATKWWLRTALNYAYHDFRAVHSFGICSSENTYNPSGVVLGFCTDASAIASAPIDPTSLLMGYRVGQMIRGMRKQQKEEA